MAQAEAQDYRSALYLASLLEAVKGELERLGIKAEVGTPDSPSDSVRLAVARLVSEVWAGRVVGGKGY